MTDLSEEPEKGWELSDETLDVWLKSDDAAHQAAAREIKSSRVYIEFVRGMLQDQSGCLDRSIRREGKVWNEINRLRAGLKTIIESGSQDARDTADLLLRESYKL